MRDKIFQSKIKILLFLLYIHLKFNFHSFLSVEKCNLAKDSAAFEKKKKKKVTRFISARRMHFTPKFVCLCRNMFVASNVIGPLRVANFFFARLRKPELA